MGIVKDMFRSYAAVNTKKDSLRFAFRLIGFDRKTAEEILSEDEEVWRTSEEGKHFKFETSTGEIKAGFGGKFNGKKLGQTWGAGHAKAPKAPTAPGKSSGNESEKRSGKGYWLHNVPESRMLEAANMMSGLKRDLRNAEIRAKSAYRLFQTGMITAGEYEDRLKPFGLENYTPNMSPEEFTMKCGKPEKKAELLGFMGEAKEWDKNADKLAKENWDEQDSKLAAALADKYGTMAQFPEAKIPDDSSLTDKWDKDDLACWYDLKSKALGGPVSEKEPPESLQIAAGLKEGTVEHPARPKADYDWYQPSSYGNMEAFMAGVAGEQVSYGHQYTKEEFADLNQKFLDKVKYDKVSPNLVTYYGIGAVGTMRQRMGLFGASKPTPEMLSRLSDKEKQDMLNTVNTFMNLRAFSPETRDSIEDVTFEDMERAERIIARLNMNSFRSQAKLQPFKDYILAQEKMLIGAEPSSVDKVGEEKKNKEDAAKAAEKAKKEQIRKEQQEFRQSDAAKEKAAKIEKIKNFNPQALASDQYDHMDVERAANDAGFFREGARFTVDHSMPKQVYVDAISAYQRVVSQFPFLAGELGGFGDNYGSKNSNAGCYKDPKDRSEIMINFDAMRNPDEYEAQRKGSEGRKWHVPVSDSVSAVEATVTHEIGHAVANWLHRAVNGEFKPSMSGRYACYDNDVATLLKSRTLKALGITASTADIKREVSEYAAASRTNKTQPKSNTKADEFFAECFCELVCSKHPRRAAVEFGKQLEKFIQENKIDSMTTAISPSTLPKIVKP